MPGCAVSTIPPPRRWWRRRRSPSISPRRASPSCRPWTRGVDTEHFNPAHRADLGLPRPVFLYVGRVAVEKNLRAFLDLELPGSKVVVGDGPALADLKSRYPGAHLHGRTHRRRSGAHLRLVGRVRLPEPHRHVRHRAARGTGERRAGRGLPGDGPDRRRWRRRRRRAVRGSCARRRWPRSMSTAAPRAKRRSAMAGPLARSYS